MSLQSSGAISMSQIKDEFGGTGSHALSEYYALAGLGVSGIPASGAISFSQFHGKSNQVTTSVWVTSGYSTTGWVMVIGNTHQTYPYISVRYTSGSGGRYWWRWDGFIPGQNYYTTGAPFNWQGYQYRQGPLYSGGSQPLYYIQRWQYQTNWVDTSAYQNTTTTAQIST